MAVTLVKCADCGFLAMRNYKTRELVDAEHGIRATGDIPSIGNVPAYDEHPVCFVSWLDFRELIGNDRNPKTKAALFHQPRDCPKFKAWRPGFTPKELQDMIDRQWMREQDVRHTRLTLGVGIGGIIIGAVVAFGAAWLTRPPAINIYPNAVPAVMDGNTTNLPPDAR